MVFPKHLANQDIKLNRMQRFDLEPEINSASVYAVLTQSNVSNGRRLK